MSRKDTAAMLLHRHDIAGRPCPICERVVVEAKRVTWSQPSWQALGSFWACPTCAALCKALESTRCQGWPDKRLSRVYGRGRRCLIGQTYPLCLRCRRAPLLELLQARGVDLMHGSACPVCRASLRAPVALHEIDAAGGSVLLGCGRCGGRWVVSGVARDYAQHAARWAELVTTFHAALLGREPQQH